MNIHRSASTIRHVASRCRISTLFRPASSFVVKRPSPSAARVAPTPLVFCSAEEWAPRHHTALSAYASALAETGFTCIESHFSRPSGCVTSTSEEVMEVCSNELRAKLQMLGYPFPPVVFASGLAALVAQTYISSCPAQGLFLVSPPLESDTSLYPDILPTSLLRFNYEPQFPIAVMATPGYMVTVKTEGRFTQSAWVDLMEVENVEGDQAIKEAERWVDELGV